MGHLLNKSGHCDSDMQTTVISLQYSCMNIYKVVLLTLTQPIDPSFGIFTPVSL